MKHLVIGKKLPAMSGTVTNISVTDPNKGMLIIQNQGIVQDIPGQLQKLQKANPNAFKGDEFNGVGIEW